MVYDYPEAVLINEFTYFKNTRFGNWHDSLSRCWDEPNDYDKRKKQHDEELNLFRDTAIHLLNEKWDLDVRFCSWNEYHLYIKDDPLWAIYLECTSSISSRLNNAYYFYWLELGLNSILYSIEHGEDEKWLARHNTDCGDFSPMTWFEWAQRAFRIYLEGN